MCKCVGGSGFIFLDINFFCVFTNASFKSVTALVCHMQRANKNPATQQQMGDQIKFIFLLRQTQQNKLICPLLCYYNYLYTIYIENIIICVFNSEISHKRPILVQEIPRSLFMFLLPGCSFNAVFIKAQVCIGFN